jgi:hypothetical protein
LSVEFSNKLRNHEGECYSILSLPRSFWDFTHTALPSIKMARSTTKRVSRKLKKQKKLRRRIQRMNTKNYSEYMLQTDYFQPTHKHKFDYIHLDNKYNKDKRSPRQQTHIFPKRENVKTKKMEKRRLNKERNCYKERRYYFTQGEAWKFCRTTKRLPYLPAEDVPSLFFQSLWRGKVVTNESVYLYLP